MATPVVIDCGTFYTRVGDGGSDTPSSIFRSLVGSRSKAIYKETERTKRQDLIIGNEVLSKPNIEASFALDNGVPRKAEYEKVMEHALRMVGVDVNERVTRPVILAECPMVTQEVRREIATLMFEKFGVPKLWMGLGPALSLLASGRSTGVVVDVGYQATHIIPMLEGFPLPRSKWRRCEVGGLSVSSALSQSLQSSLGGDKFRDVSKYIDDIKLRHVYIAEAKEETCEVTYELPDKTTISLSDDRTKCTEVLFNEQGVDHNLFNVLKNCDTSLRPSLFQNIVTCGSVSRTRGFNRYLEQRIRFYNGSKPEKPPITHIEVSSGHKEKEAVCVQAFRGGSILSQLDSFPKMYVSAKDIEENGLDFLSRREIAPPSST